MSAKENFEFLNSPIWLNYTHREYKTPDEMYYRLKNKSPKSAVSNWSETQKKIISLRKTTAVPLFLKTLGKNFWFYPADCILQKADTLEKTGVQLHQTIVQNASFKEEFFLDSMIEEAITSAIYEGANSTRAKAQELIASGNLPKNKNEWMLINNYEAMKWIKENRSRSVSKEVIESIHQIVTRNTLEGDNANFSGRFRTDTVHVRSSRNEIKHEGIPFKQIENTLNEVFQLTAENPRYFPTVIRGILLHYFIAYIHPFFDGNGRTARALFYFKAMRNNLHFVELLSVSAYLKNHGKQYEKSFEKVVGNELDITYFIDFNLDALLKAVQEVERKVTYLMSLTQIKDHLPISDNQIGLLQRLALNKFRKISIEEYASQINKSREIARQELKQLQELGFLQEEKSGKKFVYHVLKEVLDKHLAKS
ncbi:MAG: Fic family protein [Bdellovibrionaceae bacterium]|nr:Fic family protein [Pseudobdellovibrionaceae bacterium]